MTVAEFITVWNTYFKSNFLIKVTFNNVPTTMYKLSKNNTKFYGFKLELTFDKLEDNYNIYSEEYDLNNVAANIQNILNSIKVESYDNTFTSVLTLHIEGGE